MKIACLVPTKRAGNSRSYEESRKVKFMIVKIQHQSRDKEAGCNGEETSIQTNINELILSKISNRECDIFRVFTAIGSLSLFFMKILYVDIIM